MTRMRADLLLVARGLAESRAKARAAIEAGGMLANGVVVEKPADLIEDNADLAFTAPHPWVSRAGVKLAYALDAFGIDPAGRVCLDVGASTGGFTQVLLSRGAIHVYAVDVGTAQLHVSLRDDARVASIERTDARALTRAEIAEPPSLIVCDASFISATKVLLAPMKLAAPSADLVALIKPQFEAGPKAGGKTGVLGEDRARAAAEQTIEALEGVEGFRKVAAIDSPIKGGDGNLERLLHMRR